MLARCRAVAAPVAASRRREPGRGPAALGRGDVPGCRDVLNFVLPALFWLRMIIKEAFRVQRFWGAAQEAERGRNTGCGVLGEFADL